MLKFSLGLCSFCQKLLRTLLNCSTMVKIKKDSIKLDAPKWSLEHVRNIWWFEENYFFFVKNFIELTFCILMDSSFWFDTINFG